MPNSRVRTTISVREAAKLLGIGDSTAYEAVRTEKFPVPVIKIGGRYTVPVQPLLNILGIDELPISTEKEAA